MENNKLIAVKGIRLSVVQTDLFYIKEEKVNLSKMSILQTVSYLVVFCISANEKMEQHPNA